MTRRIVFTLVWLSVLFFSAHNALNYRWDAAIYFLLFAVLIELAEANGRLTAIQRKDAKP